MGLPPCPEDADRVICFTMTAEAGPVTFALTPGNAGRVLSIPVCGGLRYAVMAGL